MKRRKRLLLLTSLWSNSIAPNDWITRWTKERKKLKGIKKLMKRTRFNLLEHWSYMYACEYSSVIPNTRNSIGHNDSDSKQQDKTRYNHKLQPLARLSWQEKSTFNSIRFQFFFSLCKCFVLFIRAQHIYLHKKEHHYLQVSDEW